MTPKLGVAIHSGTLAPAAGAEVSLWTRMAGEEVGLVLNGSWFRFSRTSRVAGSSLSLDGDQNYLALTLGPTWRHALGSGFMVWASLGGGVARVVSNSQLTGQPKIGESTWVGVGTAAVSVGARLWGGFPFLELRGSYVANPGLVGLTGAFTPLIISGGYRFDAF
jgi:hypothetical protein